MSYKISWRCLNCWRVGEITFPQKKSGLEILLAIEEAHEKKMRDCKSLFHGIAESQHDLAFAITEMD